MEEKKNEWDVFYAAYGSNLHLKQMETRCPKAVCMGKGFLEDHQLIFGKRGFLDVVFCKGKKVPIGLFKVTQTDLKALDEYEEYPELYDRIPVTIHTNQGQYVDAFLYKMNPYETMEKPTDVYWTTICEGYDDFSFDQRHLDDALHKVEKSCR